MPYLKLLRKATSSYERDMWCQTNVSKLEVFMPVYQ